MICGYESLSLIIYLQRAVLEVYDGFRTLRERVIGEGLPVENEGQQELVLLNVGDWALQEVNQLCRNEVSPDMNTAIEIFNTAAPYGIKCS